MVGADSSLMGRPRRSQQAMSAVAALAAIAIVAAVALTMSSGKVELVQKSHAMSTQSADNDLRSYFSAQQQAAASSWKPSKDKQHMIKKERHLLNPGKAPEFSTKAADAELDAYFQSQAAAAKKPRKAITPNMFGADKKVKEAAPKHGMSTAEAMGDLHDYYSAALPTKVKQAKKIGSDKIAAGPPEKKGRAEQLYLPFYEVSSTGDGMGPEQVNIWKVPPSMAASSKAGGSAGGAAAGSAPGTSSLAGYPLPPNTYQDATKWNADSALNGGNKEWAEEDAALHAYNMQRWRNKILDEQVRRQRTQWDLMNSHTDCDYQCDGGRCWCAHFNRDYRSTKNAGGVPTLKSVPKTNTLMDDHVWEDDRKKEDLEDNLKLLEKDAAKALAALQVHGEDKADQEDEQEAQKMDAIVKAIETEANEHMDDAKKMTKAAHRGVKGEKKH